MKHEKSGGFTLIELMIVVAVVAILAAIAYPSYTDSVMKGKRAQARTALMELLQQQERYMTQRNCYLAFTNTSGTAVAIPDTPTTKCGVTATTPVPFKTFSGDSATNTAYYLSADTCVPSASAPTVTPDINECVRVIATPVKTDTAVGALSIQSTGLKACTGTAKTSNPSLCWP